MLYNRIVVPLMFLWACFVVPSFSLPIAQPELQTDIAQHPQHMAEVHSHPAPHHAHKPVHTHFPPSSAPPSGDGARPVYQPNVMTQITTLPARTGRWAAINTRTAFMNGGIHIRNKLSPLPDKGIRQYTSHGQVSQDYYHRMATAVDDKGPIKPNTLLAQQLVDHTNAQNARRA